MIIAITALILSLTSGIVNYRQNNLAGLESSLRDTRVQLQLAKNDITDIRMKTIQQLMEAELAVKNQAQLKQNNEQLIEKLRESKIRMAELEKQIRRMDQKISKQRHALKAAKQKAKKIASKKVSPNKTKTKQDKNSATNASASVDIHVKNIETSLQQRIIKALKDKTFNPHFPKSLDSMDLSTKTTVFYYNESYKEVARKLANILSATENGEAILRKGISPYPKNKIIVHLIGQ